jgi:serine protease AprX
MRELRSAAASSETPIAGILDDLGVRYRSYWVVNAFAVAGTRAAVDVLAHAPQVAKIESDHEFLGPLGTRGRAQTAAATTAEWNISKIGAPALWSMGITGQGIVYANADSGVTWQHPALRPHYRGWNGTSGTHDYNWWDAIHTDINGGGNPCGFSTQAPCDDDLGNSHGSHTMGTAIGDDGAGNQIGVAPGAKWISCRNMDSGVGRPSTYIECLQFFLAPTDLQGQNPDPSKRPDVVGNSYACPPSELCTQDSLRVAVDNVRAAGIFMAVSAGNEGPGCSTIGDPPAHYDSSVSVGATTSTDAIAAFSSRGPITVDGSGRLKPDLSAPGAAIRSASRTGYAVLNGTSMASPHVGGAVALLWSALPNLRRDVDATERLLEQTAAHLTTTQGCGGDSSSSVPNNVYGYGRIDVLAAYRAAAGPAPATPTISVEDVRVTEGRSGRKPVTFTVTLSQTSTAQVNVSYGTADGTASAGSDYVAASGSLTFAAGERSKAVAIQVVGDKTAEPDETFALNLSAPVNATLARGAATATIVNDDKVRDRIAPKLSRLQVAGRTLRFTLSERANTTIAIKHGARGVETIKRSLHAGRAAVRLPALAPGNYVATISARDAAGNIGRAKRTFRIG